jgi:F-type H+-transporting ATPase subunit b
MKNNLRISIFTLGILFASMALASSEAHGGHGLDDHQKKVIMYQVINVSLMFFGLFFFGKAPIKKMLAEKRVAYEQASVKAEKVKKQAEEELQEMKVRLTRLDSTAEESIMRARADAADLKKQIIEESVAISSRIKQEADAAAKMEIQKAKRQIRDEMIGMAADMAKNKMSTGLTANDQKALKDSFIQQVGGA